MHPAPRVSTLHTHMHAAECDQIVAASTPRLERSSVVAAAKSDAANTTKLEESNIRTSWGMFYAREENALIKSEFKQRRGGTAGGTTVCHKSQR